MKAAGRVYLVGAGPGAEDLLTVRAVRLLAEADIVFHDALVPQTTLELAPRALKIAVGKRCGRHSTAQHFINKQLIDAARKYAIVVRLKGGDPMIFGRSQEEIDALEAARIEVEIVPGITAALAAAAQLRVSLTQRGSSRSVTLATPRVGHGKIESNWSTALDPDQTSAIYMGAQAAESLRDTLAARGFSAATPAAVVESASLPSARVVLGNVGSLPQMCAALGDGPAIILVGDAVRRARALDAQTGAFADPELRQFTAR